MAAGSGAGAKTTSESECAQAFFCGILDYFSGKNAHIVDANGMFKRFKILSNNKKTGVIDEKNKSFNYESFKELMNVHARSGWEKRVMEKHVKIEEEISDIEKFLKKNPKWFFSSINIAESLQKEIKSRLGNNWNFTSQDYFFHRIGGEDSVMGDISDIFNYVNKKNGDYFSNINRWCPADIYISSKTNDKNAVKNLKKFICDSDKPRSSKIEGKSYSSDDINFDELNYILRSFVKNGKLLPVSLKQNGNKIQIVPIKMFNSGPPMKAVNQKGEFTRNNFKDDIADIDLPPAGEMYEISFFSSMDIHIFASEASAKKFGYQTLKLQIRDKSSSSSNRIEFKNPNSEWKFGIQGMVKFTPASAQAGGVGGGVLDKLLGINSNDLGMGGPKGAGETKNIVSSIASKFEWNKSRNEFTVATKLTKAEVDFINKFAGLSEGKVEGKLEIDKLDHCLKKLNVENKGTAEHPGVMNKLKRDKIQQTDRYKVARWFLTKYYCMNVMNKLKKSPTAKKGLKQIFAAALSLDKTGKSGKLGGGSMFFVKAG